MKEPRSRLAAHPGALGVILCAGIAAALAMWAVDTTDPACGRPEVQNLALTTDGRVAAIYGSSWWAFTDDGVTEDVARSMATTGADQQRCAADGSCYTVEADGVYRAGVRVLGWTSAERDAVTSATACAGGALTYRDAVVRRLGDADELWVAVGSQGLMIRHVDGVWERRGLFAATPLDEHPLDLGFAPLVPLGLAVLCGLFLRSRARQMAVVGNLVVVGVAFVFGPSQNVWALSQRGHVWDAWVLIATAAVQIVWIASALALRRPRAELSRNVPGP